MATSTDGGKTFGTAQETNAWAVFPQARVLANGFLVLTAGCGKRKAFSWWCCFREK
jgi:hypothetical protein|eukprot:COSAG06_NODE_1897_length_8115_cov_12.669910_12_plen_56_part_00